MTMPTANSEQQAAWNGDRGQHWADDPDGRDRVLARVADVVLDAAKLLAGDAVVDIGCGCGATSLAAARAVSELASEPSKHSAPLGGAAPKGSGPVGGNGSVLGVDLSGPMLAVARDRASRAGLTNATFVHADAQTHDLTDATFDTAISRFGTMFFDDPAAAFANVAHSLRPGGRLAIATWQPLIANDWLMTPSAALLRYGSQPAIAPGPGMFAQSEPDTIKSLLAASGFDEIAVDPVTVTLILGADAEAANAYLADTTIGRAFLETMSDDLRPTALDAMRAVMAEHAGPDGVTFDGAIWMSTARRAG